MFEERSKIEIDHFGNNGNDGNNEEEKEDKGKDRIERIKIVEIAIEESPTYKNLPSEIKEQLDFKRITESVDECGDVEKLDLDENKKIKDVQWYLAEFGPPSGADVQVIVRKFRLKNFFDEKDRLIQSLFRADSSVSISSDLDLKGWKEKAVKPSEVPDRIETYDYVYDREGEFKKIKKSTFSPPTLSDSKRSREQKQKQYSELLKRFEE